MRRLVFLLAVLLLIPSTVFATPGMSDGKGASPEEKFKSMDKNGDGLVTREEFFEFYPNMHESAFKAIDKDGSNTLTLEEWQAFSSGHARDMGASVNMPGAPGKGSTGAQMGGQGSGGMTEQPAGDSGQGVAHQPGGKPAKPLFEFTPKNEAQ